MSRVERYEYKSRMLNTCGSSSMIENECNKWAKEGWEVFSVICPNPSNYDDYRLTARRNKETDWTPGMGLI